MRLVIDVGNTRAKWALVDDKGGLLDVQSCLVGDLVNTALKRDFKTATKVVVSNVAGDAVTEQLMQMLHKNANIHFVTSQAQACGVINRYQQPEKLGADRWAALIAAWHMNKQPTVVVNAGTAVTVDALSRDAGSKQGVFMGGLILPGLRLMQDALVQNTAGLKVANNAAERLAFPANTRDAVYTGCLSAIAGAVQIMMQQLEKHCAFLPRLIVSGGDAEKVTEALNLHIKRVIIAENLVLQGLVLLGEVSV